MPAPKFADIEGELSTAEAAPRFDDIEEAEPESLVDRVLSGAKNLAGKAVDYAKEDLAMPDPGGRPIPPKLEQYPNVDAFLQDVQAFPGRFAAWQERSVSAMRMKQDEKALAAFGGLDVTGLGARLGGKQAAKEIMRAEEANPLTSMMAGAVVPMPGEGAKGVAGLAKRVVGVGALAGVKAKAQDREALPAAVGTAGVALGMEALFHGSGKVLGHFFRARAPEALDRQMAATLGPEGFVHDPYIASKAIDGSVPLSERGTVADFRVGQGTAVGPGRRVEVGPPGTRVDRPGVRGEEVTSVRVDRNVTSSGVPERAGTGTRVDRPAIHPGAKTYVGPVTAAERELAMAEAGRTRLMMPGEGSLEERAANIERLAAERGLYPKPQDVKGGQYPGDAMSQGRTLIGEPPPPRMPGERGGTVSIRRPNPLPLETPPPTKFEEAMSFLTGEGETGLEPTISKWLPRDANAPAGWKDPEATFVRASDVPSAKAFIGGGAGDDSERAARAFLARDIRDTPNPAAAQTPNPPYEPGPFQLHEVPESFSAHVAAIKAAHDKDKGIAEKLRKGLQLPENRADEDVAALIRSFRGARAMREAGLNLHERLNASLKKLPVAEREAVKKIIIGIRDRKLGRDAVGRLPQEFRELFSSMEREKQEMFITLARQGYYEPAELARIKKRMLDGELHLHRSYQAFLDKKGFSPSTTAISNAADFIAKENGISKGAALAEVSGILKRLQDGELTNMQGLSAAFRDAGLMKSRKLPPQMRKLFGVIDDPAFVIADTMGEMAQQFHLARVTETFASPDMRGKVWNDSWAEGFDPRRLWMEGQSLAANKRAFGELAGKYVKPEVYEAMASNAGNASRAFWLQLNDAAVGMFAMAKVTSSPITWLRNLISNSFNLSVSGVPPWFYMDPRKVRVALQAMKADSARTSLKAAGAGEWMRMAREDWAIAAGRGSDWGGHKAQAILEDALRGSRSGFVGAMESVFRGFTKLQQKAGAAYEFADQLPRLMAYMYHVESGVKLGMPEAAARARASHLINRYFATGQSVGPLLRNIARHGGAPFASWFVDNMRVAKNIGVDAARGDLGPLLRAGTFTGGVMGAFYALRQLGGFSDTEIAGGERGLKGSWRASHLFHDWLPVRGPKGEMYAVSFDGLHPMAAFFKGPDNMSLPKRMATNVARGLSQSGWAELPVDMFLAKAGIAPQQYSPPVLPGQEGYALAETARQYLEPALLRQFRDVVRKAQLSPETSPLRPYEEPQGLGEALFTTFNPLNIEKVGERTARGARKQVKGEVTQLKKAIGASKKLPKDEGARVRGAVKERLRDRRN